MDIRKEYERWLANAAADADVAAELKMMDKTKIKDAFYRDLAFGTGGLRDVMVTASHNPSQYNGYKVYGAPDHGRVCC